MSVEFQWIVDRRILKIDISKSYTRADLAQVNQTMMEALLNNNQKVYFVSDVSKMTAIQFSPNDLLHTFQFMRQDYFGGGYVVGIRNSLRAVANLMVTILRLAMGAKVQFMDSFQDAFVQIHHLESDLDPTTFQKL